MEAAKIEGLCKRYAKRGAFAVEDLSFSCCGGEIVGLVGHNGAGKSTTLKCLVGMLPYERGKITVCGADMAKEPERAKRSLGFVTDDHAVFLRMTGMQYLSFLADVYGVGTAERHERTKELDGVFGLGDALSRLLSSYSFGMKQKICMMGSLLHRPRLWILDEPLTGLDVMAARAVKQYMRNYAREGNAILFSSHDFPAVAELCDRAVLLKGGRRADELALSHRGDAQKMLEEAFFGEDTV